MTRRITPVLVTTEITQATQGSPKRICHRPEEEEEEKGAATYENYDGFDDDESWVVGGGSEYRALNGTATKKLSSLTPCDVDWSRRRRNKNRPVPEASRASQGCWWVCVTCRKAKWVQTRNKHGGNRRGRSRSVVPDGAVCALCCHDKNGLWPEKDADERRDEARAIELELAKLRSKLASIQEEIACLERQRRARLRAIIAESPSPSE